MQTLTKAEEQIMQILWEIGEGFVKDIVDHFENPKPAYNTVSTIVRILEKKEFVGHKAFGRTHQYYPLIKKESYTRYTTSNLVNKYFEGSYSRMLSFFVKEKNISVSELEKIMNEINQP